MNLHLAFSSCPNDTVMVDAWVHKRFPVSPHQLQLHIADIEELNQLALSGIPDVVKISYALYPQLRSHYQLLTAGSALGYGSGPLVVSRHKLYPDELSHAVIAIPGEHTTAALLLRVLFPEVNRLPVYLFSDIEEVVLSGEADAGVLIHETRFTYQKKGLQKVVDLGFLWEETTSLPVPLGAIAVRRSLPSEVKRSLNLCMRNSVAFALENREASRSFVQQYAREMDNEVCKNHINLYVNEFSVDLGDLGKKAVAALLGKVLLPETDQDPSLPIFVSY